MISGRKRLRDEGSESDDSSTCLEGDVSAAIQNMSAEVNDIVGCVGRVNGAVLESAVQKSQQMQQVLKASQSSTLYLWKILAKCQQNRATAALGRLRALEDVRSKEACVATLQQQLVNSTSSAVEEVSRNIGEAHAAAVAMFSTQLAGEQEINKQLGNHVCEFLRRSMEALQVYSRRALEAELLLLKKDFAATRTNSSLAFYQNASLRHHEEITTLMKIVRLLAAKSKDVDLANSKLRQAKAHVRLLEKHLDLTGIVRAIVPPTFVPPRPPQDPPLAALRRTAPEYFALRLLEHRDVTLSELVDSWQEQEARIIAADRKYRELEVSVERLRQEALMVHQGFLEEKRRREVVEHRLVDLVRERIHPNSNDALVRQLTQLRADYTKVLDDSAQMAAALSVTREALADQKQHNAALEAKVQQMTADSDADEVARTLASLRRYYEEEVERLRISVLDADAHSAMAVAHAESQQESAACAYDTLAASRRTMMDMSAALESAEKRLVEGQRRSDNPCAGLLTGEVRSAVSVSEGLLNKAMSSFQTVIKEMETQRKKEIASFEEQVSQLLAASTALDSVMAAPGGDSVGWDGALSLTVPQEEQCRQEGERKVRAMMREALAHALQFVSDGLVTSEAAKKSLLDVSISDAQHVSLLMEKVRELTAERDTLMKRLAGCEELIDKHSLTAVERVLMHDASLEESFDAIDASEQIATLREKVTSLDSVRAAALAEVESLREELKRDGHRAEEGAVKLNLLERHNSHLMSSLEACLAREGRLIEQVHQLQRNVQQLVASAAPDVTTCVHTEGGREEEVTTSTTAAAAATTSVQERMVQELENLSCVMVEVRDQLTQSQIAATTSGAVEGGEVETQLLHKGLQHVADSLWEALRRAELFRHALPDGDEGHDEHDRKTEVSMATTITPGGRVETASGEQVASMNVSDEVLALRERLATTIHAHASDISLRDGELARLRQEVENHVRIEESLKKSQEDLQQQNAEVKKKVARLLQINKQLVEELKTVRAAAAEPPKS